MHMHIYMTNLFYWRAVSEYRVFFFAFFFSFQMVNFKEHLPDLFVWWFQSIPLNTFNLPTK